MENVHQLRKEVHRLMDDIWKGKKRTMYSWLSSHFSKTSMGKMGKDELKNVIDNLQCKKETGHCLKHYKTLCTCNICIVAGCKNCVIHY